MFHDRVVVVTGGAMGIGRVIAEEFAKEGAHVCVNVSKKSACGVLFRVFALFPSRLYEPPGRETV